MAKKNKPRAADTETKSLIDFREIAHDTDDWELFSRDLLEAMGLYIETPPGRGSDLGKDLLVTETVTGPMATMRVRWMVSCKHFAKSKKSVNENDDEKNIRERMEGFNADGFIGVYSTIASAGLISRLEQLRREQKIKDFRIIDHREIENRLITAGYSSLMMRYFPESYKRVKPLHLMGPEYIPLPCKNCGKDLLTEMFQHQRSAIVVVVEKPDTNHIIRVFCACKGKCDRLLSDQYRSMGGTSWLDLGDLAIPREFLGRFFAMMNNIRDGDQTYTDDSYKEMKAIYVALSQKVLRAMTEEEWERIRQLSRIPF